MKPSMTPSGILMRLKLCVASLLTTLFIGCSVTPKVSVVAHQQGADLNFSIQTEGIRGLIEAWFWEENTKQVLWRVNLNYYQGSQLKYGELPIKFKQPNGAINSAEQIVPANGEKPDQLPPGKSFYLAITGQYDTLMAASGKTFYFSFSTDSEGRMSAIVPAATPKPEDFPK